MTTLSPSSVDHLDILESHAIFIIREVVAECERPVLLFSGGKDSAVLLHLAVKAFAPQKLPFPVMHVDTGHNFPEVISYRDERVATLAQLLKLRLHTGDLLKKDLSDLPFVYQHLWPLARAQSFTLPK